MEGIGSLTEIQRRDLEPSMIGVSIDSMLTSYEKQALAIALKSGFMDYPRRVKAADVA